jgi:hypothetical protein
VGAILAKQSRLKDKQDLKRKELPQSDKQLIKSVHIAVNVVDVPTIPPAEPRPALLTWHELEQRFRELEPALRFSRIDSQTGAAGEHCRTAGVSDQDARRQFDAIAAIASSRLFQDFPGDVSSNANLARESDPTIRWYKALRDIGARYEHGPIAEQLNDDGSSGGFIYTGTINNPVTASATLCLEFASRMSQMWALEIIKVSVGKYLSLGEVRRNPKLRARFMKEYPESAARVRFEKLVEAMCEPIKTPQEDDPAWATAFIIVIK